MSNAAESQDEEDWARLSGCYGSRLLGPVVDGGRLQRGESEERVIKWR